MQYTAMIHSEQNILWEESFLAKKKKKKNHQPKPIDVLATVHLSVKSSASCVFSYLKLLQHHFQMININLHKNKHL